MTLTPCALLLLALCAASASAQATLPAGTQLPVAVPTHLPMKVGQRLNARLLYPVYSADQLVLPADTPVSGTVIALTPDHKRRVHARLGGDFTPYHIPVVRFDSISLPSGLAVAISTGPVTDGAPIYRLVAPPPAKGGFFGRLFGQAKEFAKARIAVVTGPDKADRALQFLYSQLPYHPERIAKDTSWTTETTSETTIEAPAQPLVSLGAAPVSSAEPGKLPTWIAQAYLTTPISSETSQAGDKISATVAEPILNPDGSVAVPQGSLLTGDVTHVRRARKFDRAGELRFSFRQIQLPNQAAQSVRASLTGADSSSDAKLALDSEGQVKAQPRDKLAVPLILLFAAARPLDRDPGSNHTFGKDAVASNSLGLIGFIIGTAARRPSLAAGIGYYGAAVSIFQRIFATGKPVAFTKDTRVVIQTSPTRSASIKPAAR